ncbi:hypothetical protein GTR02_04650 [Kineococcus sp. R8]|uniref:hypothetical protein n=1 Tax=Kineococcus siccus TaxID=2696567 RepID=UPI0014123118|nr:hypothetical protein [Kineococcus siccus]NAZ81103.1 hypothetical protein [Kineococcus siccus]
MRTREDLRAAREDDVAARAAEPAGGRRGGRWVAFVLPVVVLALLGALVGALVGGATAPRPSATARIALAQDPPVPPASDQGAVDPDRFLQGQLLVLAGDDLVGRVEQGLPPGAALEVTATQVGTTDVAEVAVRASSADVALRAASGVVDTYRQQRVAAFQARVDASLAAVAEQLGEVSEARSPVQSTTEVRSAEYARLLAVQSTVRLAQTEADTMVTTVQEPRAVPADGAGARLRAGLMGGVLGALAGLLLVLVRSPRASRGARPGAR